MIEWTIQDGLTDYADAVATMESRVAAIRDEGAPGLVWLVEHPPLYTKGTSARNDELLDASEIPVYESGRGGRFTYHGPGQRVAYVMLDLKLHGADLRAYVRCLEDWMIDTLAAFSVRAARRDGRVGVWVVRDNGQEAKIGAIGVRVRRWVSYHGISLNVEPNLAHYQGIVPCGLNGFGVTSLVDLGIPVTMADVDVALRTAFEQRFGETVRPAKLVGSTPLAAAG